jgi:sec-independent protein translocase protein TatB
MLNVGTPEMLVILFIALIVLGPTKLPEAARQVGKAVGELKRMSSGFQAEMRDALKEPVSSDGGKATGAAATGTVGNGSAGGAKPELTGTSGAGTNGANANGTGINGAAAPAPNGPVYPSGGAAADVETSDPTAGGTPARLGPTPAPNTRPATATRLGPTPAAASGSATPDPPDGTQGATSA